MAGKIIIGNWKMNPSSPTEAKKVFSLFKKRLTKTPRGTTVVLCPPAPLLSLVSAPRAWVWGAQDSDFEREGPFTGFTSPHLLRALGVGYVLLGHSERRGRGETDKEINKKLRAVVREKMRPVLCVGETARDEAGEYLQTIAAQIEGALTGLPKKMLGGLIVAHEPVWAIGAQATVADTPENFAHNRLFIRKILSRFLTREDALAVPILYGGSVTPTNAAAFLAVGDGVLVGRASLLPDSFIRIIISA